MKKLLQGLVGFGLGAANALSNMKPEERAAKINRIRARFGWEKPAVNTEASNWGKNDPAGDTFSDAWNEKPSASSGGAFDEMPSSLATPGEVETFPITGSEDPVSADTPVENFFDDAVKEG